MRDIIDSNKKYRTACGHDVIIYKVFSADNISTDDCKNRYLVHGAVNLSGTSWFVDTWTLYGFYEVNDVYCDNTLVEVSPYEGWNIDDKVVVWNNDWVFDGEVQKVNKYFAGLDDSNLPTAFANGATSWSSESNECRRYVYDNIERVEEQ
jgi:hypothetical protein